MHIARRGHGYFIALALLAALISGCAGGAKSPASSSATQPAGTFVTSAPAGTQPTDVLDAIRWEFRALQRPLATRYVNYKSAPHTGLYYTPPQPCVEILVTEAAAQFVAAHPRRQMLEALMPLLDDPKTSADASIICLKVFENDAYNNWARDLRDSGYQSPEKPGKWGRRPFDRLPQVLKHVAELELEREETATAPAQ